MKGELGTVGDGGTIELLNGENDASALVIGLLSVGPIIPEAGEPSPRSSLRLPPGAVPGRCPVQPVWMSIDGVEKVPWYDAGLKSAGRC